MYMLRNFNVSNKEFVKYACNLKILLSTINIAYVREIRSVINKTKES